MMYLFIVGGLVVGIIIGVMSPLESRRCMPSIHR